MRRCRTALVALSLVGLLAGCQGGDTRSKAQARNTMPTNWTTRKKPERPWTTAQTWKSAKEPPATPANMIEQAVQLLNQARAKDNLPPLRLNAALTKVAQDHAKLYAKQRNFQGNVGGNNIAEAAQNAGYPAAGVGMQSTQMRASATANTIADVLTSAAMKEALAMGKPTDIGIGYAVGDDGNTYLSIVYGQERKDDPNVPKKG